MKIYIGHSSSFDYQNELYKPILESSVYSEHEIILPHLDSLEPYPSKQVLQEVDLMIAEVSYPSMGLGIELGWADVFGCKIIAIHKKGAKISGALEEVTQDVRRYKNEENLVTIVKKMLAE